MSIFSNDDQRLVLTISSGTTTLSETWMRPLFFRDSHVNVYVNETRIFVSWNQHTIKSSKKIYVSKAQWEVFHCMAHCFLAETRPSKHNERYIFVSTPIDGWQETTFHFFPLTFLIERSFANEKPFVIG